MIDVNQIYKINNFLTEQEILGFDHFSEHYVWKFDGSSHDSRRVFWVKDFWESELGRCEPIEKTLRIKIESLFNIKLETERLYLNGQAHGQCGSMHSDLFEDSDANCEYLTAVYYVNKEWSIEYGGFTVILDSNDNMHTVFPKPNSIVIFNSAFAHVGLEPTIHCNHQRVTLAHKFKVLKNDN